MAEIVRCREVDCDFEAHGVTAEEVLQKCSKHGRTAHGIQELTSDCRVGACRDARSARSQKHAQSALE